MLLRFVHRHETQDCFNYWKTTHLYTQVLFKGQKLCLMTSHLESGKPHAEERMRQLQLLLKKMTEVPDDVNVLFGGDTNLRDAEVCFRSTGPLTSKSSRHEGRQSSLSFIRIRFG